MFLLSPIRSALYMRVRKKVIYMEKKEKSFTAIDRLTGKPFSMSRGDSDAGMASYFLSEFWTLDAVRTRAMDLGKPFDPNPEIVDRLETDLSSGERVYFTESEIVEAVTNGLIPSAWKNDLVELVTTMNDIAVILPEEVENWKQQQLSERFLFANR